jgi:hypothetical protein
MQEWAGLQGAAPALQQGMCNAVQLHSEEGGVSISLDGVIVSKVCRARGLHDL